MKITIILIMIALTSSTVHCIDWVLQAKFQDHKAYYVEIMKDTVQALERKGWLQIQFQDITQKINTTMYDWHLEGTLAYTNGFLVSAQKVDVSPDIQYSFSRITNTSTVKGWIRGILNIRDIDVGFDVKANLATQGQLFYTGVYHYKAFSYECELNVIYYSDDSDSGSVSDSGSEKTPEITTRVDLIRLDIGKHERMKYMPSNRVSDVLEQHYVPQDVFDSAVRFAKDKIAPVMLETVRRNPPNICFSC